MRSASCSPERVREDFFFFLLDDKGFLPIDDEFVCEQQQKHPQQTYFTWKLRASQLHIQDQTKHVRHGTARELFFWGRGSHVQPEMKVVKNDVATI